MKSVVRSLRILEAVAQHQPVSVGELTKIFGLPKSTVQRTLLTLHEAGWLRASRGDRTRWEIGARALMVRPAALQGSNLIVAARESMVRLRDALDETVHLSVPDGLNCMVVVDRIDCDRVVRTFHQVGDTSPLHATASGCAVLAHLSAAEVAEVVGGGLARFTEDTITDPDRLYTELGHIRRDGYAINRNQYRQDVCAVAAPILNAEGAPLAAVTVAMPDSRCDPDRLPEIGELVAKEAKEIAARHLS